MSNDLQIFKRIKEFKKAKKERDIEKCHITLLNLELDLLEYAINYDKIHNEEKNLLSYYSDFWEIKL